MINGRYGSFTEEQFTEFKKKLHSKIHWMLIYYENDEYDNEYLKNYFEGLMKYINGVNDILNNSPVVIELMTTLQMAFNEFNDAKSYRKYVLSAHNIVDRL